MPNNLSMLTSVDAVKAAMAECNLMGRDEFLKHYGYKYSRLYPPHYDGHTYDSKAIVGVAFGMQHGTPLKAKDFLEGLRVLFRFSSDLAFLSGRHNARLLA